MTILSGVSNDNRNTVTEVLSDAISRGVTIRPSGKWQAQLYYAGKSRYIGVFDTRAKAALAYEIVKKKLKSDDSAEANDRPVNDTDAALSSARKAAFAQICEDDRVFTPYTRVDGDDHRSPPSKNVKQKHIKKTSLKRSGVERGYISAVKCKKKKLKPPASESETKEMTMGTTGCPVGRGILDSAVLVTPNDKTTHTTKSKSSLETFACARNTDSSPGLSSNSVSALTHTLNDNVYPTSSEAGILRGVTIRSSGKWQAQLYFAGKSRYIGVFDTREKAALAYEIARKKIDLDKTLNECADHTYTTLSSARKAAFEAVNDANYSLKDQEEINIHSNSKSSRLEAKTNRTNSNANVTSIPFISRNLDTAEKDVGSPSDIVAFVDTNEDTSYAETLAAAILRGVTMRPSGMWQAQLLYVGKSRYIGGFDTREKAELAFEIATEKLKSDTAPDENNQCVENIEAAISSARKAAFEGVNEMNQISLQKW